MQETELMEQMLPNIPVIMTAFMEWGACVVLCLPLEKRYDRIKMLLLILTALPIQYGFLSLKFIGTPKNFEGTGIVLGLFITMIPGVIFMMLFVFLLARVKASVAVFIGLKAFIAAEMTAAISGVLYVMFYLKNGSNLFVEGLIAVVAGVGIYSALYLWERAHMKHTGRMEMNWKYISSAVLIATITFICSNLGYLEEGYAREQSIQKNFYIIRALVDAFGCCVVLLIESNKKESDMNSELTAISNALNLQYKQYLNFQDMNEYIKEQLHDFKHQIRELRTSYSEEERESYLREMEETIKLYGAQIDTGNCILDSILTQKKIFCAKNNIEMTFAADGTELKNLAAKDVCSIFGNLLDNSIEHVMLYESPEKRVIHGDICRKENFLLIRIDNYYEGAAVDIASLPQTTKKDKINHGYGLKSIRYAVEKYGGTMNCYTENAWFIVKILIPLN